MTFDNITNLHLTALLIPAHHSPAYPLPIMALRVLCASQPCVPYPHTLMRIILFLPLKSYMQVLIFILFHFIFLIFFHLLFFSVLACSVLFFSSEQQDPLHGDHKASPDDIGFDFEVPLIHSFLSALSIQTHRFGMPSLLVFSPSPSLSPSLLPITIVRKLRASRTDSLLRGGRRQLYEPRTREAPRGR